MNKKNITLAIVVVVLFGASGWVIYTGIFKDTSSVITGDTPNFESNQKNIVKLLPYGDRLDFSVITDRSDSEAPYEYKKIDPSLDVGVDTKNLIGHIVFPPPPPANPEILISPSDNADRLLLNRQNQ